MRLYQRLGGWVRAWKVPSDPGGEPEVPGLSAAAVTLRHDGAIVGRGVDMSGGVKSLVLATAQAMGEAHSRLPIEKDALFEENARSTAARITVSLEVAGPMVPISPATWNDAALELAPGIDGVAARLGERSAAIFPGAMLVTGMDPGRALAAALSKASGDASLIVRQPAELAKDAGVSFYRFRTTHLAQVHAGDPPLFLHRGGRVLDATALTEAELRRWADALAHNLIERRWPGPEKYGLQDTYDPVAGLYEGPFAPPAEQALAIFALHRYSLVAQGTPSGDIARAAYIAFSGDLAAIEEGETPVWDDLAGASLFLPIAAAGARFEQGENGRPSPLADAVARCRAAVDAGVNPSGEFAEVVPDAVRPLVLLALVLDRPWRGGAGEGEQAPLPEQVAPALQSVYLATRPGELVARMPWLGLAAVGAADAQNPGGRAEVPSAVALREMRSQCWSHQLRTEALAFEQRDLAGGIVFTASRNPLPSWQSARPLAFVAAMLGDPRLTDAGEINAELVRLLASLRFLRQLSAGEPEGHMYANPPRAMWGVRASLWDQRQPIESTAMTLLAISETLRSLGALKAARR